MTKHGFEHRFNYDLNEKVENAMGNYVQQDKRASERREQYKIELDMTQEMLAHAAMKGPSAKMCDRKNKGLLNEARMNKRKSLHPDTNTDDVKEFIESFELPSKQKALTIDSLERMKVIYKEALLSQKGCMEGDYEEYFDGEWIKALDYIADIGIEICVSMNSHVKNERTFILKRLMSYNIWLLIKPCRKNSHIFVSFMVKKVTGKEVLSTVPSYTCMMEALFTALIGFLLTQTDMRT